MGICRDKMRRHCLARIVMDTEVVQIRCLIAIKHQEIGFMFSCDFPIFRLGNVA